MLAERMLPFEMMVLVERSRRNLDDPANIVIVDVVSYSTPMVKVLGMISLVLLVVMLTVTNLQHLHALLSDVGNSSIELAMVVLKVHDFELKNYHHHYYHLYKRPDNMVFAAFVVITAFGDFFPVMKGL